MEFRILGPLDVRDGDQAVELAGGRPAPLQPGEQRFGLLGRTATQLHHRPRFFGNAFSQLAEAVMRGPSEWSQGDREVMAALVSSWNQCLF